MVDDPAVAGAELDGGDRPVGVDRDRDHEAALDVRAAGVDGVGLGHLEDQVGRAGLPAVGELRGGRELLCVPLRRAGLDPVGDGLQLGVGEPPGVEELAETGFRLPRGHLAGLGDLLEEVGSLGGVFISQERKRTHLARPVATRAVLPEDRRDVLRIRRLLGPGGGGGAEDQQAEREERSIHQSGLTSELGIRAPAGTDPAGRLAGPSFQETLPGNVWVRFRISRERSPSRTVKRNVLPSPGSLSTQIRPPIISTSF